MRGASALGDLLAAHPSADVRVLVVWLPVIASDLGPPTATVRHPLTVDPRVTEFWDPTQWASHRILSRPGSESAHREGVVWDEVDAYPKGVLWADPFPTPSWSGRPIVDQLQVVDGLLRGP